ncbi:MAG: hypothetical protein H7Z14_21730 [Anaerolineae bacterium]|nr:hypothetical protein [Phycisphaerae bacterium]
MSRAVDPATGAAPSNRTYSSPNVYSAPTPVPATGLVRETLAGKHVCPFCGTHNAGPNEPCPRCTMEDTAATRQATKARIGPWYVLQARNPAAPGMKFSTLLALVGKGQVTPRSVVRGPTTHQLWRFAAHVRGLSREFGICYSCGEAVEKVVPICPHCDRTQEPPADPDALLEPRGNASAMLGGVTGNSHGSATRRAPITPPAQTPAPAAPAAREYEIPKDPPALVTPRLPRGEHSERLRVFNQELSTTRPTGTLARRDNRVSGMDLATAFRNDPDEIDGGGGDFRRVVAVLFLMAVIGGGVYYYLNPSAIGKTTAWFQDRFQQARAKSGATNPDLPVWDNRPPAKIVRHDDAAVETNVGSVVTNSNSNVPKLDQPFVIPSLPAPSTQPVVPEQLAAAREVEAQPAAPDVNKQLETPATQVAEAPKQQEPPKVDDAPPAMSDDLAISLSRKLWTLALDAEGRGDFAEAVRCYEEIKQLPKVAHQGGLDIRLANAKRNRGR